MHIDLDIMSNWLNTSSLKLNVSKTKCLIFSRNKTTDIVILMYGLHVCFPLLKEYDSLKFVTLQK